MTAVDHTPIADRDPRVVYGNQIGAAVEHVIAAVRAGDGPGLQHAVDEALALPQPAGEDPVHWLAAALAMRIPEEAGDA